MELSKKLKIDYLMVAFLCVVFLNCIYKNLSTTYYIYEMVASISILFLSNLLEESRFNTKLLDLDFMVVKAITINLFVILLFNVFVFSDVNNNTVKISIVTLGFLQLYCEMYKRCINEHLFKEMIYLDGITKDENKVINLLKSTDKEELKKEVLSIYKNNIDIYLGFGLIYTNTISLIFRYKDIKNIDLYSLFNENEEKVFNIVDNMFINFIDYIYEYKYNEDINSEFAVLLGCNDDEDNVRDLIDMKFKKLNPYLESKYKLKSIEEGSISINQFLVTKIEDKLIDELDTKSLLAHITISYIIDNYIDDENLNKII